jgi:hypothetical protein
MVMIAQLMHGFVQSCDQTALDLPLDSSSQVVCSICHTFLFMLASSVCVHTPIHLEGNHIFVSTSPRCSVPCAVWPAAWCCSRR